MTAVREAVRRGVENAANGAGGPRLQVISDDETLTDTGNSSRLVEIHGERLRYIPSWGKWLWWNEEAGRWLRDDGDVRVREAAKDVGTRLKHAATETADTDRAKKLFSWAITSLNASRIGGMVDLARGIGHIPIDHSVLDADGWLLGVPGGVVDLRTGDYRDADPADLMTMQCATSWDPWAEAPRWLQALEEWFPDSEVRSYVQRLAGAALVGGQRDHVFVIHYGGGRNGKGTFTRALQNVLGPYSRVIHLSLLVQQRHSQHDTVKADLFRVRLAVASETQQRVKLDEASVKNLTGGDTITARRMREDSWEFAPTHSLWLQTNHLPEIAGRDGGIWGRIRVVKWVSTFDGKKQDQRLSETLANEASGILRWLVDGCLQWQRLGLSEPEAVIRETLAYRRAEDTFSRFASDVGLTFERGQTVPAAELNELLEVWAEEEGVRPEKGEFGEWLRENGAADKRDWARDEAGKRKQRRIWVGVGFRDGTAEVAQTEAQI